jgi:hypothetical protein
MAGNEALLNAIDEDQHILFAEPSYRRRLARPACAAIDINARHRFEYIIDAVGLAGLDLRPVDHGHLARIVEGREWREGGENRNRIEPGAASRVVRCARLLLSGCWHGRCGKRRRGKSP